MKNARSDPNPPNARAAVKLLARCGIDIRAGEARVAGLLFGGLFLVICFQYVAKTVRQSTFISAVGATNLPWVYLAVAVCSYPLLRGYLRLARRFPSHQLSSATCVFFSFSLVLFCWLYGRPWAWVPVVFYLWTTVAFGVTVSQFWSYASQLLDARQAKRLFGLIGAGGLLGGIAGGQAARLASESFETRFALLGAAGILASAVVLIWILHRTNSAPPSSLARSGSDPQAEADQARLALPESRYLRIIGLTVGLGIMTGQIIDLQFNWAVEKATSDLSQRTAYFGNFFSIAGGAAFLFQLLLTSRIHRVLGVGFAMRILPISLGIGTGILLAVSGMLPEAVVTVALLLQASENGLRYSVDGATRELLFVPIPAGSRIKAKAFIDFFLERGAKGLAAVLLLPVTFGLVTPVGAGWLSLVLIAIWLISAGAVYQGYVQSFRRGLKERSINTGVPINIDDVKTVELLVQSLGSAEPRQVLHSLDILAANGRGHLVPPLLLYHDDAEVRLQTLRILALENRTDAAPLVERRLADEHPDVRAEAIRALTTFQTGDACALMFPRLQDPDPRVRALAVTCLLNHGEGEMRGMAAISLRDMLCDGRSEVRSEAVKALGALEGTEFRGRLLQALNDSDYRVAREGIQSVRRIVAREGFQPLYLPHLIALLQNRRLKHDARETIVVYGAEAVPALVHFMKDPGESILVRRALPKALARIGGEESIAALIDALADAEDAALRAQLVEALAMRREDVLRCGGESKIRQAVVAEARRFLRRLGDLRALGAGSSLYFDGPLVRWNARELSLLTQMVAERIEEHLETMFGLLALLFRPKDVWAAHRSLISGRRDLRAGALEYLENTLPHDLRRHVFAAIGDAPVEEKLRLGEKLFGLSPLNASQTIGSFLGQYDDHDADGPGLTVAALYSVYTEELTEHYKRVTEISREIPNPLIRETAAWVRERIQLEGN